MTDSEHSMCLSSCYGLGVDVARIHNHWADTGVECAREHTFVKDAREQVGSLANLIGDVARERFAAGYDETIDFSLNSDWRLP